MSDGMQEEDIDSLNLADIKSHHLEILPKIRYKWLRQMELTGYIMMSMVIHVGMLIAGKILLTAEGIKNKLVKVKTA
jgi:hypothetical protein